MIPRDPRIPRKDTKNLPTIETHAQLLEKMPRFGPDFKAPSKRQKRKKNRTNLFGESFKRLLKKTKIYRPRMGFGWIRHTFQMIGDGAKDSIATKAVMGHTEGSISDQYREG